MIELESLHQAANQFLQKAHAPMEPEALQDEVRSLETRIASLSDPAIAERMSSALESVARWDYLDSTNSVIMRNIFLPEIKRFVAIIGMQFQAEQKHSTIPSYAH